MSSNWQTEIGAVFRKELACELRSRTGLVNSGLFSVLAVVVIAFASKNVRLVGSLASGLMWIALLFAAVVALPRAFVAEEEQGTADLLRLMARPHSIYWGKVLFNCAIMSVHAAVLTVLFVALAGLEITNFGLLAFGLAGGVASLAGTVTLCGALVAQAANRSALVGAIALPLLIPVLVFGVAALKPAFGDGLAGLGWQSGVGLWSYAAVTMSVGPPLFAATWKA